ncbi:mitochondrial matrix iron-sulfur protein [Pestalotiopsis sp. IQ-011]
MTSEHNPDDKGSEEAWTSSFSKASMLRLLDRQAVKAKEESSATAPTSEARAKSLVEYITSTTDLYD